MSVYRYINNTDKDVKADGFIVRAYDELISSVEVPALTKLVDYTSLVGLKDGMRLDYITPTEAEIPTSSNIELHETVGFAQVIEGTFVPVEEPTEEGKPSE